VPRENPPQHFTALLAALREGDNTMTDETLLEAFYALPHGQSAEPVARSVLFHGVELCMLRPSLTEIILGDVAMALLAGPYSVKSAVHWAQEVALLMEEEERSWLEMQMTNGTFQRMVDEEYARELSDSENS
jgi:hypothetical protein